jgi:cobalt-zinc-cadmium efflux system outer membrane protein
MRRLKTEIALAVAALCIPAVGDCAASPSNEAPTVTWEEVAEAARNHPELLAAASRVDEAAGAARESGQYPNPVLGLALGRAEGIEGGEEEDVWDIELKLPVLPLGEYRNGARAAEAEHAIAVREAEVGRLEVLRDLKEAFLRVAYGQESLSVLEASSDQLATLVGVARKRVEMGEARPMELSRLEIEAGRAELALAEVREDVRAGKKVLNLWLRSELPENYRVEADLSDLPRIPPVEEAVEAALARHPEVGSANLRVQAAEARLAAQRWARFPEMEIGGFYEKEPDARSFGGTLELHIPIWNWNSGGIARARAAEKTARHRLDARLAEVEAATRESHAAAVSAYARVLGFRDEILPRAVEVAGAMETMYRVGEADVMNVLDARRKLIEIESELLEAYLRSQLAYLRLAAWMGEIGDD